MDMVPLACEDVRREQSGHGTLGLRRCTKGTEWSWYPWPAKMYEGNRVVMVPLAYEGNRVVMVTLACEDVRGERSGHGTLGLRRCTKGTEWSWYPWPAKMYVRNRVDTVPLACEDVSREQSGHGTLGLQRCT